MSINNVYNYNSFGMTDPGSLSGPGSSGSTSQSGIMQMMSQLLSSLSQMLSMGGQNGQFQSNPTSDGFAQQLGGQNRQSQFQGLPDTGGQNRQSQFQGLPDNSVGSGQCGQGRTSPKSEEDSALGTLDKYKRELLAGNGNITKEDLKKIAETGKMPNGDWAPEDLKKAAEYFKNNPSAFDRLEDLNLNKNGGKGNKGDGNIGIEDFLTLENKLTNRGG